MDDKLINILKTVFNLTDEEFSPELRRSDVVSWDSLQHMALVFELEAGYAIKMDVQDIMGLESFPDITALLIAKGALDGE